MGRKAKRRLKRKISKFNKQQARLHEQIKDLEREASQTEDDSEAEILFDQIVELEESVQPFLRPPSVFVEDITPEGLYRHIEEHLGLASLMEAEGGVFDRFAASREMGVSYDLVLKSFSGEPVKKTRATMDETSIDRPLMTFAVFPQPGVLRDIVNKAMFREKGLMGRIIYFAPHSLVGGRNITPAAVRKEVEIAYSDALAPLLNIGHGEDFGESLQVRTIELSEEAEACWLKFAQKVERRLGPWKRYETIRDWGTKFPGTVARICGIFHAIEEGPDCHKSRFPRKP